MESPQNDDHPPEEQMVTEEETLEGALPFDDYGKDTEQLRGQIERLEKEYDEREKVIDRIMEYGTGIENEKDSQNVLYSRFEKMGRESRKLSREQAEEVNSIFSQTQ